MAEDKKGFVLYADLLTVVEKLVIQDRENNTNYAGELFLTILQYVNDKNPIPVNFVIELAFEPIKIQLKRDLIKWENMKDTKSKSGILGNLKRWHPDLYEKVINNKMTLSKAQIIAKGRKSSQPDSNESQKVANIAVNVNVNDSVNVNVINKENVIKENAYNFLIQKSPQLIEIFEMQNKKSILNYDKFIEFFNNKVEIEELKFKPKILMSRLINLKNNWNDNKSKENETKKTIRKLADEITRERNEDQKRIGDSS